MNRIIQALLCLLLLLPVCGARAEGQSAYIENEWNFAEGSMDVSGGIPRDASGALGKIARRGVLRVAVTAPLIPRVFTDPDLPEGDQLTGADIRLARCIAERMGVRLKIVPLEETQLLTALSEEHCDLAISALSYTPGRALACTMSKAYHYPESKAKMTLVVRQEDRDRFSSLADLENRTLVAQSNSLPEAFGAMHVNHYLEFRRVSSPQTVFETVARGEADAGLVLIRTAEVWFRLHPDSDLVWLTDMAMTPDRVFQGDRVAARKGETQLIWFVNGVIDGLLNADAYQDWLEEAQERADELGL